MFQPIIRSALLVLVLLITLTVAWLFVARVPITLAEPERGPAAVPEPWLMFHRDEQHTGIAPGVGAINPATGPRVRWTYKVTDPPRRRKFKRYRWYSSFPLGDLDGDGTLEVVVTTPDNSGAPSRIIALKDTPGQRPRVRPLWVYTSTVSHKDGAGYDQYSAALADADGDGRLDVIFTSKGGMVRALKGTNGKLIWKYNTRYFIEAGPMIADLDGDGSQEVIVPTGCKDLSYPDATNCPTALFVFRARPSANMPDSPQGTETVAE